MILLKTLIYFGNYGLPQPNLLTSSYSTYVTTYNLDLQGHTISHIVNFAIYTNIVTGDYYDKIFSYEVENIPRS